VKEYSIDKLRNVSLISHGGAGKTSLVEAMLFNAGETNRLGRVDDGTTMSDYHPDEIERKISITTSILNFPWKDCKVNILDTPGYSDFLGEVRGALRVTEMAVVVIDVIAGIEVGTEQVWRFAEQEDVARVFFINRLDKEHANFDKVMDMLTSRFGPNVIPLVIPVNEGVGFDSVVDLVKMKLVKYEKGGTGKTSESEIPADLKSKAEQWRTKAIEAAAESDDAILEDYFENGTLTDEQFKTGLHKGILAGTIFPVLCGSAYENIGVKELNDFLVEFAPSPDSKGEIKGKNPDSNAEVTLKPSENETLATLVFKTESEPHVGEFSFFRVYSGVLRTGDEVLNVNQKTIEKIGQIYAINGKNRREIGYAKAGDIAAVVKMKNTHTGDTLTDRRNPVILPSIEFPEPVIRVAVEPKSKGDEEKISNGLQALHEEDPTFVMHYDPELRQTIIAGQGELHLAIVIQRLKNKFGVDVNLVEPKIPYQETIKGTAEVQGKYKRQSGGRGQYGDVWIRLEPLPRGAGFEFVDAIVGGVVPSKYIPAVEKGIREAMDEGILAGYPVRDVKVTLYDGSYHSVDSSDLAFKIAGSMAFKKAFMQAKPVLLEPIYDVEVRVPEEFLGDVMGDLSSRRGKILGIDAEGPFQVIRAKVPLAELYKYSTALRSLTQGRGIHRCSFSHYEEVPSEIAEKIIAEAQKKKEEEK